MTWSYSGSPKDSQKDQVRFLIGDTDEGEPLISDEEIEYCLDTETNIYAASALAAEAIASSFSRKADTDVAGVIKETFTKTAENYSKKSAILKTKATEKRSLSPYAGGSDRPGSFTVGMEDYETGVK